MNINLHIFNAKGRLTPYIEDSKKSLKEIQSRLPKNFPIDNLDIGIFDSPETSIPELGLGGHTLNPNYISISIDPEKSSLKSFFKDELIDTLAHEFHHVARWRAVGYGETLLEAIVSEGLADCFANEITGRSELHLWSKALNKKQINFFLNEAKKEFNNKKYSHQDWFFGSKNKKIPRWTGYSLGYYLVKEYLEKHPNESGASLYKINSKEFI